MAFNESQNKAVDHLSGPLLVLAGPGSGKTTVITHRTKKLILEHGINPSNILVITFTKAAAVEMQERFYELTGGNRYPVSFGTFHAIYFKILKYAYNYSASNILAEDKKYEIIKEITADLELEIDDETEFISGIISEISQVKSEMINLDYYYSKNCGEDIFKKIYKRYNDKLVRSNVIDFDDMLVMCYELFVKRPDILKMWQEKYKYILIDEFQDINKVQYEVVKMLASPENNLFIVGDDDQSVYRFRGAKPEIMLNFPKDYKDAGIVTLDTNYRSTNSIIEASLRVINYNKSRFGKEIRTIHEQGEHILIKECKNSFDEAKQVIEFINEHIKQGGEYKDIAVIYRTNTNPRVLVEKLMEFNLPFKIKDALPNIYEHFLSKNILSYINIAMGNGKRSDYLQIINRPKRYISREAFRSIEITIDDLRDNYKDKSYVIQRLDKLEYDLNMLKSMNPYSAINYIRHGIGYEEYIKEYADYRRIKPEELYEVLDELAEASKPFKNYQEWFLHIENYGKELIRQNKERMQKKNCIELSTMHSSKGLEYEKVIILDANEGITPHKKSVLKEDIEEERRLFYVAMTRAKKILHIYYCKEKYGKNSEVSRFVEEIVENDTSIKVGVKVIHMKYGEGIVRKTDKERLKVYFPQIDKEIDFDKKTVLSKGIIVTI